LSTGELGSKTFTVFANASVILASASRTNFLGFGFFKGIRTLFECNFNGGSTMPAFVVRSVQATDTGTGSRIARLANLKASTVELETPRANAVTGFTRWKLWQGYSASVEGPRIAGENGLNGLEDKQKYKQRFDKHRTRLYQNQAVKYEPSIGHHWGHFLPTYSCNLSKCMYQDRSGDLP
jgi:hypothetical protein